MKQSLFFLLAFVLLTITPKAQIAKGSVLLGGNFRAFFSNSDSGPGPNVNLSGFTISPVYGKATRENLVWGVEAGLGSFTAKYDQAEVRQTGFSLNAGVFVRKYKPIGKSGFYGFIQGRFAFNYSKNEALVSYTPIRTVTDNLRSISLSVNPGLSFAVSKRFHLETGLNNLLSLAYYSNDQNEDGSIQNRVRGFELNANLSNMGSTFYVGFRVLIDKSKS